MKTKQSKSKLVHKLNKETIANLNYREIGNVRGREKLTDVNHNGQVIETNTIQKTVILGPTPAPLFPDWFPSIFVDCP
jgi:hypothetical protein